MLKIFNRPSSHEVAEKMVAAVEGFNTRLQNKSNLSAAEKRHLMRLRATAVLDTNQVIIKRRLPCQNQSNQNARESE
jgi:hypothetical protein